MSKFGLVLVTVGSEKEGDKIAQTLVKEKLAACVNIIPQIKSYFNWRKKFYKEKETLLLIKTEFILFEQLKSRVLKLHSYETPEIVMLSIAEGFKNYFNWMEKETKR